MNNEKIEKIDKLILEATKNQERDRINILRLIKSRYMEFLTAKNAKPLDDIAEMQILKKMADEHKESIANYQEALDRKTAELNILNEFLPKEPTDEEIKAKIEAHIELGIEPIMKNMGMLIKKIKEAFPAADGKKVSDLVKSRLS